MSYLSSLQGITIIGGPSLKAASQSITQSAVSILNNYSLGFRGSESSSGYVGIGKPSDLDFNPQTDSFTISCWFKIDELDFEHCILAKANMDGGLPGVISVFIGVDGTGQVYALVGGGENTAGGNVDDGNWHLVTLVVTGGNAKLYLDTVQVGSTFAVGSGQNTLADWIIGGSRYTTNNDLSYPWKGFIDEPTFWDSAFSLSNILELYNNGIAVDPTTHSKSASLLHWYRMGDDITNDLIPIIKDQIGNNDGTINNPFNAYLFASAPNYTPSSLDLLTTDSSCDLQFNANNYSGSGNWSSTSGSWIGVVSGTPTKQAASQFPGQSEILTTGNTWFRLAASGAHSITGSTTMTYVFRMKTGLENGTGGFYCGYNGEGAASDWQVYNFFYDKDAASRIRVVDDSGDYLTAESHDIQNQDKYVTIHVVINMPDTSLKVYVNGGLLVSDTSGSGIFLPPLVAPLGILGVANISIGGNVSTAEGQSIMEVARYRTIFTDNQIARQAAIFNALKGYI